MKSFSKLSILAVAALSLFSSCSKDNKETDDATKTNWDKYEEYRNLNILWLSQQEARVDQDGNPFYTRLVPQWNRNEYILIHWFNDQNETAGNLMPLFTSTVNVWYVGRNCLGVVFDADTVSTNGTTLAVKNVIEGWQTALQNMHVGDSVEIILPYQQAYGGLSPNTYIPPYSTLQFNLRLRDIPQYEVRP